jgi:hypothetical protein
VIKLIFSSTAPPLFERLAVSVRGCRLERALICRSVILSTHNKRKNTVKSTLAITWPQGVQGIENSLVEAAQVMAVLESGRSVRFKKR